MGVSTDAVLFYGYAWEEDGRFPPTIDRDDEEEDEDSDDEWQDRVLTARGVPKVNWDTYNRDDVGEARQRWEKESGYAVRNEAKKALTKDFPCEIGGHCSGDYPMPYVYLTKYAHTASRGEAAEVAGLPEPTDEEKAKLAAFIELLKIDVSEAKGPGWLLVSYWG